MQKEYQKKINLGIGRSNGGGNKKVDSLVSKKKKK